MGASTSPSIQTTDTNIVRLKNGGLGVRDPRTGIIDVVSDPSAHIEYGGSYSSKQWQGDPFAKRAQ